MGQGGMGMGEWPMNRPTTNRLHYEPAGISIGAEGDGIAVDLGQSVHGRLLLRLFLGAAPGRRVGVLADYGRHLETLVMVGTLFVQKIIARRGAELALGHLLQD